MWLPAAFNEPLKSSTFGTVPGDRPAQANHLPGDPDRDEALSQDPDDVLLAVTLGNAIAAAVYGPKGEKR